MKNIGAGFVGVASGDWCSNDRGFAKNRFSTDLYRASKVAHKDILESFMGIGGSYTRY